MESDRRTVPETLHRTRRVADHQYAGALRRPLGADVFYREGVLVADGSLGDSRGSLSGARVHHLARLRPWLLLQVATSQSYPRSHHRSAHLHALFTLALGTRRPSCDLRRSGSPRHRRYLDAHGTGISRIVPLEALRLSAGAQSGDPVCDRAIVYVFD